MRVPPYNLEAEEWLLGAVIQSEAALRENIYAVDPDDFHSPRNRDLWRVIREMHAHGDPVDVLTLGAELKRREWAEAHAIDATVVRLLAVAVTTTNAAAYAQIVTDLAAKRRGLRAAEELVAQGYDPTVTADEYLGAFAKAMGKAITTGRSRKGGLQHIMESFEWLEARETAQKNHEAPADGQITWTGYVQLDKVCQLVAGDVTVLAARPSIGKSAFAQNLALNVAGQSEGNWVFIFSLEMGKSQMYSRFVAQRGGVNIQALRLNTLRPEEWDRAYAAVTHLMQLPIALDTTPGITCDQIYAECVRAAATFGPPSLVIIDYLQLMGDGRMAGRNRNEAWDDVTARQKVLAGELGTHVMVLSQLSRAVESRDDKRPMLSDLRESGGIEQNADNVWFLYAPERYTRDEGYTSRGGQAIAWAGKRELLVAKQRNGPLDSVWFHLQGPTGKISEMLPNDWPTT